MNNLEHIVRAPYNTQPRMSRNTGPVFNSNPRVKYLNEKVKQLESFGSDLYGFTIDCVTNQLIRRVESFTGKAVTGDIVEFALSFEEDIAIMHRGCLAAICFCFPSSWVPNSALGKSLYEIHEPVADGEQLRKVSGKLASVMSDPTMGSFERFVWTINRVPELSNHPDVKKMYDDTPLIFENLFFRVERQTTLPLSGGQTSLFFVNVEVTPLRDVWDENKSLILESINSMSDKVLIYKNLTEIKFLLNSI
jgi:hypothetical protein